MKENRGIRGRSVTSNTGGSYSITDINNSYPPGFLYTLEIIAIGGGGGAGGYDGLNGGGGASGSIVSGSLNVAPGKLFYIGVGGGGGGGIASATAGLGGAGGTNGGGDGGFSGGAPNSGSGGAGGGWSGLYSGKTYYIIAGGGAGGGGANEGGANDTEARGGGKQVAVTNTLNGSSGVMYASGDGGGGAGGGGGYWGGRGQANVNSSVNSTEILSVGGFANIASGGGNYTHPSVFDVEIKLGNNGSVAPSGAAGAANTTSRFNYVTGPAGNGAGGAASLSTVPGIKGNVIIRYAGSQKGQGGTIVTTGGYTYHMFTSEANIFGPTTFIT